MDAEIKKAAGYVAFDWPGVIDEDDIEQEIWLRLLESPKAMGALEEAEPALRMDHLKRMGVQIASRYANDYEVFSGNVFYSSDRARRLLSGGLLTARREDLGEINETLSEFLDLHEAFRCLKESNKKHADSIWCAFVENSYDKSTGTKREFLRYAVGRLTELMNQARRRRMAKFEDGVGSRKIVSNATAQRISSNQYSGDYDGKSANYDTYKRMN